MRTIFHNAVALLFIHTIAPSLAAQQSKEKPPKVITLSGCVQRDEKAPDQFVLTDRNEGIYRLSGRDFREYLGRPVTVNGGVVAKGFVVKGGLQPTPNIAAQAGALDPSRAAVQAATAESTTGRDTGIPEFRVKKIQSATGNCSE